MCICFFKKENIINIITAFSNLEIFQDMATTGWQVCIINSFSFHSFWAINLELCTGVADILKMCTCLLWKEKLVFDKIRAFSNFEFFIYG